MSDKKLYYKRLFKIYGIAFSITLCIIILIVLINLSAITAGGTHATLLGALCGAILIIPCIPFIFGFKQVEADEIGLILEFGKPVFQVSSGLIFTPFPFSLQKETRLVIEEQYPEDDNLNGEKEAPIHITHGASQAPSSDALDNRITTSASIVCRYRIIDLMKFITTIGDKKQLRRQIRDIVVTTVKVECAKETVGKNYRRLPEINSILKKEVERLTKDWGIEVVVVLLQHIDLGGAINDALKNVPVSIINMEVNRNNAQKILYDGIAEAEVQKAFQFAKAEGYKQIAKQLNITEPLVIYQIDTLAKMWSKNNADVNLFSGDMAEVFKMVTAFSKVIGNSSDNKKLL